MNMSRSGLVDLCSLPFVGRRRIDEKRAKRQARLFHEGEEIIEDLRDPFMDWQTSEKTSLDDFWDGVDRFVGWRGRLRQFILDYVEAGDDLHNFVKTRLRDKPLTTMIIPRGRYPDVGGKHATTMTDREVKIPRPEDAVAVGWKTGKYYITDSQGKKHIENYKATLKTNLKKLAKKLDEHITEYDYKNQDELKIRDELRREVGAPVGNSRAKQDDYDERKLTEEELTLETGPYWKGLGLRL